MFLYLSVILNCRCHNMTKFSLLANYRYQDFHHHYDVKCYLGNFCEHLRNVVDTDNLNLTYFSVFSIFACNVVSTIQ